MLRLTILISLLLMTTSCSTNERSLTEKGEKVKVLNNRTTSCAVIGKFKGIDNAGSVELARNHARNQAGEDDASAIYFEEEFANGSRWVVHAIAYSC